MRRRMLLFALLSIVALSGLGLAEESPAYSLMVSDQDTRRLESFTSVQIYTVDAETQKRLDIKPVFTLSKPANPLKIWLDPGYYEFTISVSFVDNELTYFRFEIVEGERTLIDLTKIEFPDELQPKEGNTR